MKLSIIIPVYNSEKYIIRCLDSIYNEEIPESEFEAICVDDFSKDCSLKVLKSYSKSHSNLLILSHSKNMKQGAARNYGLEKSKGKYIWFVDSDDYIEKEIIKTLFQKIDKTNPDILQFNAKTITMNGIIKHDIFLSFPIDNLSGYDYLKQEMLLNYENRLRSVWSKWYKREFLYKFNLFFEEGIFWEDIVHTLKAVYSAPQFLYVPVFAYNYVETQNSDLRGKLTAKKFIDTIYFCISSMKFLLENCIDKDLQMFLCKRYLLTLNKYKIKIIELDFREFILCFLKLQKMDLNILSHFMDISQYSWLTIKSEFIFCWLKKFRITL